MSVADHLPGRQRNRLREDVIAAVVLMVTGSVVFLAVQYPEPFFGKAFSWTSLVYWFEDALIATFCVWYLRDHAGQRVVRWWHSHHGPLMQAQLEVQNTTFQGKLDSQTGTLEEQIGVLRDNHVYHVREELTEFRSEVAGHIADLREEIRRLRDG